MAFAVRSKLWKQFSDSPAPSDLVVSKTAGRAAEAVYDPVMADTDEVLMVRAPIQKELAQGRWFNFSVCEQLGNVGSEFERAARAFRRGDHDRFDKAFARMLELLDLTAEAPKWHTPNRLRELRRLREEACDVFQGGEIFGTPIEALQKLFFYFAIAARAGVE